MTITRAFDERDRRDDVLTRGAAGAASGVAAAAVMGLVFLVAGRLGLMGENPPEVIARKAARRGPAGPRQAEEIDAPLGTVLHLGFGGALGAVFAIGAPALLRRLAFVATPARELLLTEGSALAFASLVYVVSYAGWVPALNLLPPADRDRPGRQISTLIGHLVFGATLAAILDRSGFGPRGRT